MSRLKVFVAALMGLMLMLVPTSALAQQVPPCTVMGTAYLNGKPVSEGKVSALIGGEQVAETVTGMDGGYYMQITGNYAGREVSFRVNGVAAQETITWEMGITVERDLHARRAVGTTPSPKPKGKPARLGVFGKVVSVDDTSLTVETKKRGKIKVLLADETRFRGPFEEEIDLTDFQELFAGAKEAGKTVRVALSLKSEDGELITRQGVVVPGKPAHLHITGVITSIENNTITIEDKEGRSYTIGMPQGSVLPEIGAFTTIVGKRGPGKAEISGKSIQQMEKLLGRLEKQIEKLALKLERLKEHVKEEKGERISGDIDRLKELLEENAERQIEALEKVKERVPEEAKSAIERALEMSRQGKEKRLEAIRHRLERTPGFLKHRPKLPPDVIKKMIKKETLTSEKLSEILENRKLPPDVIDMILENIKLSPKMLDLLLEAQKLPPDTIEKLLETQEISKDLVNKVFRTQNIPPEIIEELLETEKLTEENILTLLDFQRVTPDIIKKLVKRGELSSEVLQEQLKAGKFPEHGRPGGEGQAGKKGQQRKAGPPEEIGGEGQAGKKGQQRKAGPPEEIGPPEHAGPPK